MAAIQQKEPDVTAKPMLLYPYQEGTLECGCDEAGRGCLAGPVVAAAVILDPQRPIPRLDDSKKLSAASRQSLAEEIKDKALAWTIGVAQAEEIDAINILQASFLAMHRAIEQLSIKPELLLIDGNRFKPYASLNHICIVKGDGLYQSIAAASILAKTYRDQEMEHADQNYPNYHWKKNKGYPTPAHFKAIEDWGITPLHRKSFKLSRQMSLFPILKTR
jgi:ribonuclease HII